MSAGRDAFSLFLAELGLPAQERILEQFDRYLALLQEKNKAINLFSRSTAEDDLWTKHFLDSLLPLKCLDLSGKNVLDFGSGGGLPGIPLKLAQPAAQLILLDSVHKKTAALEEMVAALDLNDCAVLCGRLEELAWPAGSFDYVLCRAVRLEERYLKPLRTLLKAEGQALFYKAKELDDIAPWQPRQLLSRDFAYGHRAVWALDKAQLKH